MIGALGAAGLAALGDWRATGLAREALLTTPAVWRGGSLVAAPLVRPAAGFGFRRVSAIAAAMGAGDRALNPPGKGLC